ncbi:MULTISPECIES: peptide-methionine (S)-S-oxide reductase MsrA [Acidiplasma]|jgi:peptide-methionine (S)-S-oxide reductase|uniref:Peptide methionine sulfoxide reductase MsrA n=2 Tax=Acidiplasma TaxID=507753 RepID=A0A0Q0RKX3_9ARCH|nr:MULTISPECIES: peptide-methionine (S)-S-oxide reductase MsrA [Acidiplasma]KJE48686.1 methionine sulfoxide reductase A [Acidiplasma sp. MBA-1]KQB33746.1 methionine sulfoxide reductase A [Acidiplasma aeolicum]KQB36151.1 methionine sulfoxide reductase A [Acidiplasma cupricumulans]WMT55458.1 MAG: peptide-methionine (S)-S-oxide reductase MsrA [Acidiplasma sp.]
MEDVCYFAGGCFWCMEAVFKDIRGVVDVQPGYSGGTTVNPTYEQVCSQETGHAETVKIRFDNDQISFNDLLEIYFSAIDPTTLNRQGEDIGTNYRTAIFYTNEEQRNRSLDYIKSLEASGKYDKIVVSVEPYRNFYPAEDYHKDYFAKHPEKGYCRIVIKPKVEKVKQKFSYKLKPQ